MRNSENKTKSRTISLNTKYIFGKISNKFEETPIYLNPCLTHLTASLRSAVTARSSSKSVSSVGAVALISREMWSDTPRQMIITRSRLATVIRVISSR